MPTRALHVFIPLMVVAISLTGCVTTPAPQGQAYSAGYVGDRASLSLGEQVFTINVGQGPTSELRNLHLRLEVIVNPRSLSFATEYEVAGIIRRIEPRIEAHLVDFVPLGKSVAFEALPALKGEIVREAQATLLASYSKWKKAADFDVQVEATSYYLTDLSAGTPATTTRGWW
jgi:hypothetical protein